MYSLEMGDLVPTSGLFEQCVAGIFAHKLVGTNGEHHHTLGSLYD